MGRQGGVWWRGASVCVVVLLLVLPHHALVTESPKEKNKNTRCTYERAQRMLGANCWDLNMPTVPTYLKSNIEILELTFNRIRELRNTTFEKYTSIRYLYLGENMIQTIEAGAFEPLSSLEILDLSMNSLRTIPAMILNIPTLRKLNLSENKLVDFNYDLKLMEKPLQAPLWFLSLANCFLHEFPDLGQMTDLEHLNVSSNEFQHLNESDLTGLCALKVLDISESVNNRGDSCAFHSLSMWVLEKRINVYPDAYTLYNPENEVCPDIEFTERDVEAYTGCAAKINTIRMGRVAKKTWMIIAGVLSVFLLCFVSVLYWLHRRNVKNTKKSSKKTIGPKTNVDTTANLLSDVS